MKKKEVVCLEGNGSRPSHQGIGWSQTETMYTLNGTEVHAVAVKVYAVHEADGQDVTVMEETAYALVTGGGKPGQGYPCIWITDGEEKKTDGEPDS